ncbi:hypothetical protein EB796_021492 [Bugula neritina]|uniref:F-box domain-containing protein n=1 Tax=Bugula neritina TaxID=10212 RepID=A0A7J7J308_BUGNE|nr:hypothetical protein EB796_021492 [Bugula neritina]
MCLAVLIKDVLLWFMDIHILNDDCLLYIFSFLSPKDLINCAEVCQRWRDLSLISKVIIKELKMLDMLTRRDGSTSDLEDILKILSRIDAVFVTSLDLSFCFLHEADLSKVIAMVPAIKSLKLDYMPYSLSIDHIFKVLMEHNCKVTALSIRSPGIHKTGKDLAEEPTVT